MARRLRLPVVTVRAEAAWGAVGSSWVLEEKVRCCGAGAPAGVTFVEVGRTTNVSRPVVSGRRGAGPTKASGFQGRLSWCDVFAFLASLRFNLLASTPVPQPRLEVLEELHRSLGDDGAGAEDVAGAGLSEGVVVLGWDHPADDDDDV